MTKSELRKKYLQERKLFSSEEIEILSKKIFNNFQELIDIRTISKVHVFLSIDHFNEIKTGDFIKFCWENKVKTYVPKVIDTEMISVEYTENSSLERSSWGIFEPESNLDEGISDYNLVITPLVYCDAKGNRVGYGKGFYDKFFQKLDANCLKIGVSFFDPNEYVDDFSDLDIPLDYLVTPTRILSFIGF